MPPLLTTAKAIEAESGDDLARTSGVSTAGSLPAAGAGRRFGTPKASVEFEGEALVPGAARALTAGDCEPVAVVPGARVHEALESVPHGVAAVDTTDWAEGMGASLRAGPAALAAMESPVLAAPSAGTSRSGPSRPGSDFADGAPLAG